MQWVSRGQALRRARCAGWNCPPPHMPYATCHAPSHADNRSCFNCWQSPAPAAWTSMKAATSAGCCCVTNGTVGSNGVVEKVVKACLQLHVQRAGKQHVPYALHARPTGGAARAAPVPTVPFPLPTSASLHAAGPAPHAAHAATSPPSRLLAQGCTPPLAAAGQLATLRRCSVRAWQRLGVPPPW